jgi:hypothetical protein
MSKAQLLNGKLGEWGFSSSPPTIARLAKFSCHANWKVPETGLDIKRVENCREHLSDWSWVATAHDECPATKLWRICSAIKCGNNSRSCIIDIGRVNERSARSNNGQGATECPVE